MGWTTIAGRPAFDYNGIEKRSTAANASLDITGDHTYMIYMIPGDVNEVIKSKGTHPTNGGAGSVTYLNISGYLRIYYFDAANNDRLVIESNNPILLTDQAIHVATVLDITNDQFYLYVNGVSEGWTISGLGEHTQINQLSAIRVQSGENEILGQATGFSNFSGIVMDEFLIPIAKDSIFVNDYFDNIAVNYTPPATTTIAFGSDRPALANLTLWTMNERGQNPTEIDAFNQGIAKIRWSPNKTRIAFFPLADNARIRLVDPDGGNLVVILPGFALNAVPLAWSPDSSKVFYTNLGSNVMSWYLADNTGSNNVLDTTGGVCDLKLTGDKILYRLPASYDLMEGTLNAPTYTTVTGVTALRSSGNEMPYGEAYYSPDGTFIAFTEKVGGIFQAWTMDADGGNPTQITSNAWETRVQGISPNSQQIVTAEKSAGIDFQIWTMDKDGGSRKNISNNGFSDALAAW